MYKSFTEMPVWQKAHKISVVVFQLTVDLPRSEDYGLTSQIRRSSNSVSANISEAFGRKSPKDKSYFYTIARGSAYETQNHLIYSREIGYFKEEIVKGLIDEYSDLIFELNKIMKSLNNSQH
ncbi:MAG: four helix bundle protein [Bacteroidota bacterium]